jgi:hypothetical protein
VVVVVVVVGESLGEEAARVSEVEACINQSSTPPIETARTVLGAIRWCCCLGPLPSRLGPLLLEQGPEVQRWHGCVGGGFVAYTTGADLERLFVRWRERRRRPLQRRSRQASLGRSIGAGRRVLLLLFELCWVCVDCAERRGMGHGGRK